jgi:flagella basal body P-ring formation protein FlgA
MAQFNQYRRKQIAELRPVTQSDINQCINVGEIYVHVTKDNAISVSISDVDLQNGSPKLGDMIARNPKNHLDQWLVAEQYFNDNFELNK